MFYLTSLLAFDNLTPMNWDVIMPALNFLWQGLLAIFVVIGLIIIAVKITAFIIGKAAESKKRSQESQETQTPQNNP